MRTSEWKADISNHGENQQPLNKFVNVKFSCLRVHWPNGQVELLEEILCNILDERKIHKLF